MPLPTAEPRSLRHTRTVQFHGYERNDGLWDIEGAVCDTKTTVFVVERERTWSPGEPIHGMAIRVTLDNDLVVRGIAVAMDHRPHTECTMAQAPMQRMVGCSMARGWRKSIDTHLGTTQGCAHLRELLVNMATVAFQTMPHVLSIADSEQAPKPTNNCIAWDSNGTMVARLHPRHIGWLAPQKNGRSS